MKRNVDKIKELERELGRYRKKVEDDAKFQENLRARLELAMRGNQETNQLVDAILTQAAITYGVDAVDPDDATVVLGKRLELPMFDAQELRKTWEVKARRDTESGKYIIGIMRRERGRHGEE